VQLQSLFEKLKGELVRHVTCNKVTSSNMVLTLREELFPYIERGWGGTNSILNYRAYQSRVTSKIFHQRALAM